MKAKVFVSQVNQYKEVKKTIDYWGILFVGLVFTASLSCFFIDSHRDIQKSTMKTLYPKTLTSSLDLITPPINTKQRI